MPVPSVLKRFTLDFDEHGMTAEWQDDAPVDGTTWHELLRPFVGIRKLRMCRAPALGLSFALQLDGVGLLLPGLLALAPELEQEQADNAFSPLASPGVPIAPAGAKPMSLFRGSLAMFYLFYDVPSSTEPTHGIALPAMDTLYSSGLPAEGVEVWKQGTVLFDMYLLSLLDVLEHMLYALVPQLSYASLFMRRPINSKVKFVDESVEPQMEPVSTVIQNVCSIPPLYSHLPWSFYTMLSEASWLLLLECIRTAFSFRWHIFVVRVTKSTQDSKRKADDVGSGHDPLA
ncbi:hypothetical protein EDB87DRAFT_1580508 [Lactarius vividus]|nr:hypothetical protein EDB87DRAFT_1580508 [Lactarius vividus]